MNQELSMNANKLVAFLQKPTSEFTKADIISFIQQNDIRMVNFMYPAGDGRLKTLNFVINNQQILDAHYAGKFRTHDGIEHVIRVLALNNKFTYIKDNESNTITIN